LSDGNQNLVGESLEQEIEEEEADTPRDEQDIEEEGRDMDDSEQDDDVQEEDEEEIQPEPLHLPQTEKRDRRQPIPAQEQPSMHLKRQEKRTATRDFNKPTTIPKNNDRRNRPAMESPIEKPIERYSELDNPSTQLLPPGTEASRQQQLFNVGELQGLGRKTLMKAASRMQAYRTAFIDWQAQRDDYVIFQNTGRDENTGLDRWEPMHYALHFLTVGQSNRIKSVNYKIQDLRRAAQNNDLSVKDVYTQIDKAEDTLQKLKLSLYFRMYIGKDDDDPDDELQRSSQVDVRDMLDSAEWCFQWVPKSRRIKPSEPSGSKTGEIEYDMIR
jgi:hypothetical protein